VAAGAGVSVGLVYKLFAGKQELLDEVIAAQLDAYERMRTAARSDPDASPLQMVRRELRAVCSYLAGEPRLMAVLLSEQALQSPVRRERLSRYRQEDVALFERAVARGEIAGAEASLLYAAYRGVVGSLLRRADGTGRADCFAAVPDLVDELLLRPLARIAGVQPMDTTGNPR